MRVSIVRLEAREVGVLLGWPEAGGALQGGEGDRLLGPGVRGGHSPHVRGQGGAFSSCQGSGGLELVVRGSGGGQLGCANYPQKMAK